MMLTQLGMIFVLFSVNCWAGASNITDPEERLMKDLLNGYDNTIRPGVIKNGVKEPLQVRVLFAPDRIIGLDDRLETMSVLAYIVEKWEDPRLVWNPEEYGGMEDVDAKVDKIWTPRSLFPNLLVMNREDKTESRNARINLTRPDKAEVILITYAVLQERCKFYTIYYPFDWQTCSMCVAPSQYTMDEMEYTAEYSPRALFLDGGEWDLKDGFAYNDTFLVDTLACLQLTVQRRSLYYIVNLLIPTVCICLLNTIGLFASIDSHQEELEFATSGQTTLLSLSVLLLTVADQTPRGSENVSLLGVFFLAMIFQTLVAAVTAVYLRKWHKHNVDQQKVHPMNGDPKKATAEKKWVRCCMVLHLFLIAAIFISVLAVGYVHKQKKPRREVDF